MTTPVDPTSLTDDQLNAAYAAATGAPAAAPTPQAPSAARLSDEELKAAYSNTTTDQAAGGTGRLAGIAAAGRAMRPHTNFEKLITGEPIQQEPQATVGGTLAAGASGVVQGLGSLMWPERWIENKVSDYLGVPQKEGVMTAGFHDPQNMAERVANVGGNVAGSVPVYAAAGESLLAPMIMAGILGASETGAKGGSAGDIATSGATSAGGAGLFRLLGGAISKAITPHPTSAAQQGMADTLRQEGVPITAGTATGSKNLRYKESVLGQQIDVNPDLAQQQGLARAGMRRTGQDSGIDPGDIQSAYQRIGYEFERIGGRNNMTVDPQLQGDLTNIAANYHAINSPLEANSPDVNAIIQHIGQPGRVMPGPEYNRLRSLLSDQSVPSGIADNRTARAMGQMRDALDDAFERSIQAKGTNALMQGGPNASNIQQLALSDFGALRQARQQYRNLLVMTKAVNASGEGAAQGALSPAALASAAKSVYGPRAYATGQGDLTPLAQAAAGTMKPLPQSGTAPRQNVLHDLNLATILGGTGAAGGEYARENSSDPNGLGWALPILGALSGVGVNKAVTGSRARTLLNPTTQAYLANRVLSPQGADMIRGGTAGAGAALAPQVKPKAQDMVKAILNWRPF